MSWAASGTRPRSNVGDKVRVVVLKYDLERERVAS
jgi:ribosomal protein S1